MDFQDGHSKEYLEDGSFAQDNSEVPLALVRVSLLLHYLLTWRYSAWPIHKPLSSRLSISRCTLNDLFQFLHMEVQTLGQLGGVVSVRTINRKEKTQWHHSQWHCKHGQLCLVSPSTCVSCSCWESSKHLQQCSVKSFYLPVPLGVMRCCSKACYATELFQSV